MVFSHNQASSDSSSHPNAFLILTTDGNFAISVYKLFIKPKDGSRAVRLVQLDVIPNVHSGGLGLLQNTSSS